MYSRNDLVEILLVYSGFTDFPNFCCALSK
jgi:hypothetical protein